MCDKENVGSDITYSVINNTPKNMYITKYINKILSGINNNIWINDNLVNICGNCKIEFTFYRRKHHCRGCGKIFCYYCSSKYINSYVCNKTKLIDKYKYISMTDNSKLGNNRVCDNCYNIFIKLNNIKRCIGVIKLLPLDIKNICKFSLVSCVWNETIIIYLSIFRNIQYILPIQEINRIQKNMLKNNVEYIVGHNKLMYNYIKYNIDENIKDVLTKFKSNNKKVECKNLLCNLKCNNKFGHSEILDILKTIENIEIRKYMINNLELNEEYLLCYITYLVSCVKLDSIENPLICDYLVDKTINFKIGVNIFFELRYYSLYIYNIDKYVEYYYDKIYEKDNILIKQIVDCYNYFSVFGNNFDNNKVIINKYLEDNDIYNPFANNVKLENIKYNCIIKKNSYTKPLIIPYNIDKRNSEYIYKNAHIMYKYENVRKDRIVTDIIKLIDILLKEENLDLDIVKYDVLPINEKYGIIDIVQNSKSVFDIIENKKTSLLNYILENNPEDKVDDIKKRFIKSTGAYSIITYLLGIGDRHLDNIMITNRGILFHIDFSFLLGIDPKLYAPTIRIIPDMMEVIGGTNSYNYLLFKNICNKCYNILRQNTNVICSLLSLLPENEYSRDKLEYEILSRFNPSEIEQETDIYLNTTIENSKDTYNKYIDIMYYYNQKNNISNILRNLF